MGGLTLAKYQPHVVLLENLMHKPEYVQYMRSKGYTPDVRVEYNYLFFCDALRKTPSPESGDLSRLFVHAWPADSH